MEVLSLMLHRACLALPTQRNNAMIPRAMSSSFGDVADDSTGIYIYTHLLVILVNGSSVAT